jgi:hypothetical protein
MEGANCGNRNSADCKLAAEMWPYTEAGATMKGHRVAGLSALGWAADFSGTGGQVGENGLQRPHGLVSSLNSEVTLADLAEDIVEIGYPQPVRDAI